MTNREFMMQHTDEHLPYCRCCRTDDESSTLIIRNGKPVVILTPELSAIAPRGTLPADVVRYLAKLVNPNWGLYHGYTDAYIAFDAMRDTGCAGCPLFCECRDMYMEVNA